MSHWFKTLPQELVDLVIDHLYDDTRTVRSCTLVCKSFLPSSSKSLFERLTWPPCTTFSTLDGCVCLSDRFTLDSLLQTLTTSHRISANIRSLRLTSRTHSGTSRTLSTTLIHSILDTLPRLQSVELSGCRLTPIGATTHACNSHSIKRLVFAKGTLDYGNPLEFLTLFHHIKVLYIERPVRTSGAPDVTVDRRTEVEYMVFDSLPVDGGSYRPYDAVLNRLSRYLKMNKIYSVRTNATTTGLAAFITACSRLRRLDSVTWGTPTATPGWPRLRHLRIGGPIGHHITRGFMYNAWPDVMQDLSNIDPSRLRSFELFIDIDQDYILRDLRQCRKWLSDLDWAPVGTFVSKCTRLTADWQLQVECFAIQPYVEETELALNRCAEIAQEIAMQRLPSTVTRNMKADGPIMSFYPG